MTPSERVGRAVVDLAAIARALPLPGSPRSVVKAALQSLDVAKEEFDDALREYMLVASKEAMK